MKCIEKDKLYILIINDHKLVYNFFPYNIDIDSTCHRLINRMPMQHPSNPVVHNVFHNFEHNQKWLQKSQNEH